MRLYELGLDFDMSDVSLYALKNDSERTELSFIKNHVFKIFDQLNEHITWGSFGVIVGDPQAAGGDPPYVWTTKRIDAHLKEKLDAFLGKVNAAPTEYLILGQLGEELHKRDIPVVPCLIMTAENIAKTPKGVKLSRWSESIKASLFQLSDGINLSSFEDRWQRYHADVKYVTDDHKNSICYIPAVCRRKSDKKHKVLGGGLVLCVKNGHLPAIFEGLPDIQIFLRLLFTELLLAHGYIGATVRVPPFIAFLQQQHLHYQWFKDGGPVPHNFPAMDNTHWVKLKKEINPFVKDFPVNCETFHAMKELSSNGLDVQCITPSMLALLAAAAGNEKGIKLSYHYCDIDPIWGHEAKFPMRNATKSENRMNNYILSEFYSYMRSALIDKKLKKQLIKSIEVDCQSVIIKFDSCDYAEELAKRIRNMFEAMINESHQGYHDASTHLGRIVVWSGYNFCDAKCDKECQEKYECKVRPSIVLYNSGGCSVLRIAIKTEEIKADN